MPPSRLPVRRADARLRPHSRHPVAALTASDHDIIDRLYLVAVEPERFGDLVETWDRRIRAAATDGDPAVGLLGRPAFAGHVERAEVILDRLAAAERFGADPLRDLIETERTAAFVIDPAGRVRIANRAARTALGLAAGVALDGLPFLAEDRSAFAEALVRVRAGEAGPGMIRLRLAASGRLVLAQMRRSNPAATDGDVVVVTTELVWPPDLSRLLRATFDLTRAETDVIEGLVRGSTVQEIATATGRSEATLRTHVRAILGKTGARSQTELVRIVLGLMDIAETAEAGSAPAAAGAPGAGSGGATTTRSAFRNRDGRVLEWYRFGAEAGRTVVYLPGDLAMGRFTPAMEADLVAAGLGILVPVRAGYGRSTAIPSGKSVLDAAWRDVLETLDHLRIDGPVVVMTSSSDVRIAVELACRRPDRVRAVIGIGAVVPAIEARHYARMSLWHRFICGNARFAPGVLPYLVRAGFFLAMRVGVEGFVRALFADVPGDLAVIRRPEVMAALVAGSELSLAPDRNAATAMARSIIEFQHDWSDLIDRCPAPITLFNGEADPECPIETLMEYRDRFPKLAMRTYPGEGRLVYFSQWPDLLDLIRRSVD